jgi:AcrR family transcriptional regulator
MKHGDKIKAAILAKGLELWPNASARAIARAIGCTHGNVLYHFKSALELQFAIARHAVATGDARIVPQLIAMRNPAVADMSDADRARYLTDL